MRKVSIFLVVFFLVLSIGVFASGQTDNNMEESSSEKGKVTLYSSNNQGDIDFAITLFNKLHPNISVSVVRAGTGATMQRIQAETENPLGDIFWSGGFGTLGAYEEYFVAYESSEISSIPDGFIQKDHMWTGTNIHPMVIMYNKNIVDESELPTKWSDLFDPKWEGQIVMGDPVKSGSAYMQVYGLYQLYGKDGLEKISKTVQTVSSSSMVYKGVSMGEYALGITMEYAAYNYIAGGQEEIGLIYPKDKTFISPEGTAIIKNCKNLEEAQILYDFFCSKEAQQALFEHSYRRPTRTDIMVSDLAKLPALEEIDYIEMDYIEAADFRESLIEVWSNIQDSLRKQ